MVWVATIEIELAKYAAKKLIAIVMNGATFDEASEIDYLMTNVNGSTATRDLSCQLFLSQFYFYLGTHISAHFLRVLGSSPPTTKRL